MHPIRVLLPQLQLPMLDYLGPNDIKPGDFVVAPFRNKEMVGVVYEVDVVSEFKNLREISYVVGLSIPPKHLEFALKASKYYMTEPGSIAKLMLPVEPSLGLDPRVSGVSKDDRIKSEGNTILFSSRLTRGSRAIINSWDPRIKPEGSNLPSLSPSQAIALAQIQSHKGVSILQGVTGSGKTEVYFHLMLDVIKQGKQVLLMLPEIALSSQIIDRFIERFDFKPDIWNSSITPAKKRKLLARIISGDASIVIGTRSSLFLPYKNLGLIVIDEEHDASYKQESGVLYNARDMAVLRSTIFNHPILLGSATPSIETLHNAQSGKYNLVQLDHRFGLASMPEVKIIDMRTQKLEKSTWLSRELKDAIAAELGFGNQAMLFLNRRGYAPMMLCAACGHRVTCKSCSSWMVMHKARKRLECHHCGDISAIKTKCSECGVEDSFVACGPGVERIAEEVAHCFQNARIQLMTKEEMNSEVAIRGILKKIENQEIDILIGTQIITKGYHFPKLSLVGVIDADIGLGGGDLKGSERAFQLLHQVSGRAGREDVKGKVYLQTYDPEARLIKLLQNNEFDEFSRHELSTRMEANMPPFSRMVGVLVSGKKEEQVLLAAKTIARIAPTHEATRILGPAPAMMSKLQNKYRYRLLLITERKIDIQAYIKQWLGGYKAPSGIEVRVDVDPYSFY